MEPGAHVTSIDALRLLRTALLQYDAGVRDGVDSLALQVRRAVEWLEVDRMQYWPAQIRRASERLTEAENALERCQLRFGSEDAPSCYEQKKAVESARRRLRFSEEKLRKTKGWIRAVRQEVNEFQGQLAKMNNCLDGDLPRAIVFLERMIEALEKYAEVTPGPTRQPDASAGAPRSETDRSQESAGPEQQDREET